MVLDVSGIPGEVAVGQTTVTFTPTNWATPQTITVSGIDDLIIDGDQSGDVSISVSQDSDPAFRDLENQVVHVTNQDDDVAGLTIVETNGTRVSETGSVDTFTVRLSRGPLGDVELSVVSQDLDEAAVDTDSLTFTQENWDEPQVVRVMGIDDNVVDGDRTAEIVLSVLPTSHSSYVGLPSESVEVVTEDDDIAAFVVTEPAAAVDESGTTTTFEVRLDREPLTNVFVDVASQDLSEADVSPGQLTFTSTNWNQPQTVTILGLDDFVVDGAQTSSITVSVGAGSDAAFANVPEQSVDVVTEDDDFAGFSIGGIEDPMTVSEDGTTIRTIMAVLDADPTTGAVLQLSLIHI